MAPAGTLHDGFVHDALRDQLVAILPPTTRIRTHGWRPWASASFTGARHWFDVNISQPGDLPAKFWPNHEWTVSGSFVADVAVAQDVPFSADWRIDLLTVDD